MIEPHIFPLRVYFEDTDAGGIVYYANYLRFAERARTEMLRSAGIESGHLMRQDKITLTVKTCHVDYQRPAHLDDLIEIQTKFESLTGARITVEQTIYLVKNETIEENWLVRLRVQLACVSNRGKATRVPKQIRQLILDVILNR